MDIANIALWASGIVIAFGITCIFYALQIKSKYEDLKRENEELETKIAGNTTKPRDIRTDRDLMSWAKGRK